MPWPVLTIVVAILAAGISAMIITMIVGAVRSTRGPSDWDHSTDAEFLPWNDDDGDSERP